MKNVSRCSLLVARCSCLVWSCRVDERATRDEERDKGSSLHCLSLKEREMATLKWFEEIEAWQRARLLTKEDYECSRSRDFYRDFALRDQIRRAAVSVMSNIAEGFERGGRKEFLHFLSVAKASAGEVEAQLYVALDQAYITDAQFARLKEL